MNTTKIAITLLLALIATVSDLCAAPQSSYDDAPRISYTYIESTLSGYSMHPTIKPGDKVIYRSASIKDVRVGDIVVFNDPITRERVCHRVVAKYGDTRLKTKGDNNRFRDRGYITDLALRGIVTHINGTEIERPKL